MFSKGNAVHPVECDSLLEIVMAFWSTFFNLNLLGRVWQPAADYNSCLVHLKFENKAPNGHYYLQRTVTLNQIT